MNITMNDFLPLVTIRCLTYNHESYIAKCLDGFVMQQTNFKFEAIVHDDASTDGTADIIRKYAEKYPDIIKPIYQTENQYSKQDGSIGRIMNDHMRGKYIAMCEGDDYWVDPLKLQKQVDFLEANSDYGLVCTDKHCLYQETQYLLTQYDKTKGFRSEKAIKEGGTLEDVLSGVFPILTLTVMMRCSIRMEYYNSEYYKGLEYLHLRMGDTPLWAYVSLKSKMKYIDEATAVYRKNLGSATRQTNIVNSLLFVLSGCEFRMYCIERYNALLSSKFKKTISDKYEKILFKVWCFDKNVKIHFELSAKTIERMDNVQNSKVKSWFFPLYYKSYNKLFLYVQQLSYKLKK